VEVKPGETAAVNFAPSGRTVIGKIKFPDGEATDFRSARGFIRSPMQNILDRMFNLKSDEERKAFAASEEYKAAQKDVRMFPLSVAPDGSFSAELVPPGKYEIGIQSNDPPRSQSSWGITSLVWTFLVSRPEIIVPEVGGGNEDTTVDLGTVQLLKFTRETAKTESGAK
jgi:hypothetical protein